DRVLVCGSFHTAVAALRLLQAAVECTAAGVWRGRAGGTAIIAGHTPASSPDGTCPETAPGRCRRAGGAGFHLPADADQGTCARERRGRYPAGRARRAGRGVRDP